MSVILQRARQRLLRGVRAWWALVADDTRDLEALTRDYAPDAYRNTGQGVERVKNPHSRHDGEAG